MSEYKTWRRVKLSLVREKSPFPYSLSSSDQVVKLVSQFISDDPRENVVALYLDAKHQLIAIHRISIGSTDSSPFHPREIFLPAIHLSASAVIVAHNHPSGDPAPSPDDRLVTRKIRAAGELLSIPILDHLVIGFDRYYSFASESFSSL